MALKVGFEDRKKVAALAALGLVAVVYAGFTLFSGPSTPPVAPAARVIPVTAPARPVGTATSVAGGTTLRSSAAQLDPTLHPEVMAENEAFVYNGIGRNIFSLRTEAPVQTAVIERPRGPIRPTASVVPVVDAGPPPPPAIDLRFYGYSARRDGSRKAFLLHGDDLFIASEGDVVSHRYRVVRIAPTTVMVEDLPYHNTQSLPLVQN